MQIYLDGTEMQGEGADSVAGLRAAVRTRRRVPTVLRLDGREAPVALLASLDETAGARLDLETVGMGEAAVQAFAAAQDYMPKVCSGLDHCCEQITVGKVGEAMADFGRVCQGVSWFFQLVGSLGELLGPQVPGGAWDEEARDLKELLLKTEDAIAQQDWVLVGDQLRYEWSPRLHAWSSRLPQAQAEAIRLFALT